LIGRLVRLVIVGGVAATLVDRWLAARAAADSRTQPEAVHTLAVIDAPIDRVWSVISDIPAQPRWMTDMKAVRMDTPGPVGVGSRGEAWVRMFGVGVSDPVVITEFEPPHRFAVRHEGPFAGEGIITLESGADGTTTIVRWSESIVPPVLPWLSAVALRPLFRAVFRADLERLTALVESEHREAA
jgi:uncharacterized protein YndB with AHSA1/START domain